MLKILIGRIPLQINLYSLGFQGPSKCFCCNESSSIESIDHLFVSSEFASYLWKFFEGPLGIQANTSMVRHKLSKWWLHRGKNKFFSFLHQIIPILICWYIWKARNAYIFDGKKMCGKICCENIFSDLIIIFNHKFPSVQNVNASNWILFVSFLDIIRPQVKVQVVAWSFPRRSQLKLNTNGCFKKSTGTGGGGGVLRDENGRFVMAYAFFFGQVSRQEAEIQAVDIGIQICLQKGFRNFCIETDSAILVDAINHKKIISWKKQKELKNIMDYSLSSATIKQCFCEANRVAGYLANYGI